MFRGGVFSGHGVYCVGADVKPYSINRSMCRAAVNGCYHCLPSLHSVKLNVCVLCCVRMSRLMIRHQQQHHSSRVNVITATSRPHQWSTQQCDLSSFSSLRCQRQLCVVHTHHCLCRRAAASLHLHTSITCIVTRQPSHNSRCQPSTATWHTRTSYCATAGLTHSPVLWQSVPHHSLPSPVYHLPRQLSAVMHHTVWYRWPVMARPVRGKCHHPLCSVHPCCRPSRHQPLSNQFLDSFSHSSFQTWPSHRSGLPVVWQQTAADWQQRWLEIQSSKMAMLGMRRYFLVVSRWRQTPLVRRPCLQHCRLEPLQCPSALLLQL